MCLQQNEIQKEITRRGREKISSYLVILTSQNQKNTSGYLFI